MAILGWHGNDPDTSPALSSFVSVIRGLQLTKLSNAFLTLYLDRIDVVIASMIDKTVQYYTLL